MAKTANDSLWELAHAERAALAEDLASLTPDEWRHPTLCGRWNVEQVVAHLTAAASLNRWQWIRSMLGAGFRPDVHNQRRLEEHQGDTPAATLDRFRATIDSSIAPTADIAAFLGEVVVHAQDIRRPLRISREPRVEALAPVAEFFAGRNFTVPSRTHAKALQLKADDGAFVTGEGSLVSGPTLALVMTMAGRPAYLDVLEGAGVPILRARLEGSVNQASR